jgi:formylglycine-generating enzyme required for sulfatase activity
MKSISLQEFSFESPQVNRRGEIIETQARRAYQYAESLGSGIQLIMVAIPGGSFRMGSLLHSFPEERPPHWVVLPAFFLAQHPVTQSEWLSVMGKLPPCRFPGAHLPVDNLSYQDTQNFCHRLSQTTGKPYRLPSEAEWEYACCAGTVTPYSTGETITTGMANYCGEHVYLDEPRGLYRHITTPPGSFPPNSFGLEDMHGNLWEICADSWHPDYEGAPSGVEPWENGGEAGFCVARGGSWHEPPENCRSSVRLRTLKSERDDFYGFRPALSGDTP